MKSLRSATGLLLVAWLATASRAASIPEWIGDTRQQVQARLETAHRPPVGQALVQLARGMLGRPYSAFSLDTLPNEELRLNLTSFDCVLLVEQLLALIHSRTVNDYPEQVASLRYENGRPNYCERNHYFSLWAHQAEKNGILKDLSPLLPGAAVRTTSLTFMSQHAASYEPMRLEQLRRCIHEKERTLTVRQAFVPISALAAASAQLQSGDIFALVTSVAGLDVTHTGILERTPIGLQAIHAVPKKGVVRSTEFVRYASGVEDVVGVSFYRPLPTRIRKP
jgi:hypothetical protein